MPEQCSSNTGICIGCISTFFKTQLHSQGAKGITCITLDCRSRRGDGGEYIDWRQCAHEYLPKEVHQKLYQETFDLWLMRETVWQCPAGCQTPDTTVGPSNTPGYPHVYCSVCKQYFCAGCRVLWHEGMTCQRYRAQHPELMDENEAQFVEDMAKLGAKRCPSCQYLIIKDGGCPHMAWVWCGEVFFWSRAEKVMTVKAAAEYEVLPAKADDSTAVVSK